MTTKYERKKKYTPEEAIDVLFGLPDDPDVSDCEPDDAAEEEFVDGGDDDRNNVSSENNFLIDIVDEPEPEDNIAETFCSWSDDTSVLDNLNVDFTGNGTPDVSLNRCSTQLEYFSHLFTNEMIQHIVYQTNLYARQESTKNWVDTSAEEIRAWIGMNILMGIVQLPRAVNYWSSDPILGQQSVSKVMTCKRYKKLCETIHFNDNETLCPNDQPGYDKLHKVRPIINFLNESINQAYVPSKVLAIDETMIPFKGRSSLKQYMPDKPIKRGYKVWSLADSKVGYVSKFEIYTGKTPGKREDALGEKVVLNLLENYKQSERLVAFDNFYTSVNLMERLLAEKIYSVGTVRINRKGLPSMMKEKLDLQRGEFQFQCKKGVAAIKWMDSKPVTLLSTADSPRDTTTVARKMKDGSKCKVWCPTAIDTYNKIMGGVDHFDQFRETYAIGRRSVKWWHRIMYFLIDVAIVDAFILWKTCRRSEQDQLSFRLSLARQLIGGFCSRKSMGRPASFIGRKKCVPNDVRLTNVGDHMPRLEKTYRRCRLCSLQKQQKRTRYICTSCNVPLCAEPCFRKFHGK